MQSQKYTVLVALLLTANIALAAVRYVDVNSASPASPYTNWATGALTIQDAIDVAVAGDQILVTNGVYQTGGRTVSVIGTNRVAVTKAVTVQSVNGPEFTVIRGYQVPGTTNGSNAIRCTYLSNGATLSGFTLTNGATLTGGSGGYGGGAWLLSGSVVTNCVLAGNSAFISGGGAYGATDGSKLYHCTLQGNTAGAVVGGGGIGGGAYGGIILYNCLVISNSAPSCGGTAFCTLINCTVAGNSAVSGASGGVGGFSAYNCIVYYNSAAQANTANHASTTFMSHCCTFPYAGPGTITSAPQFANQSAGDFRLQSNSPCINSGTNFYAPAGPDLDSNPRIAGGTVDIGAYECTTPALLDYFLWAQSYGVSTTSGGVNSDPDQDFMNNWKEWICGTVPTNALSVLRLLNPVGNTGGVVVTWQSVTNRTYFLERGTNLTASPAFLTLATNLQGQSVTTSFTDTNSVGLGTCFYRIGVQ